MHPVFLVKEALSGLSHSFTAALAAAAVVVLAALALAAFLPILGGGAADEVGATGTMRLLAGAGAALLALASVAFIAYTTRLSIHLRRREVEVMRLVGATNWFIRGPFLIEGLIVGLAGGAVAVGLLVIAMETFMDPLSDRFALAAAPETIDFPVLIVLLLVACLGLSAIGAGIALRRLVRV
jgi:cell division transport system permease protein